MLAGPLVTESSCQVHSLWPCVVASRREISVHQSSIDHYLHHSLPGCRLVVMQCGSNSIKHEQHSAVMSSNVHDELEPENITINLIIIFIIYNRSVGS